MTVTLGIDASVVTTSSGGTRTYALQLLRHLVEIRPDWSLVLYLRADSDAGGLGGIASAANVRTHAVGGRPNVWRVQALLPAQLDRDRVDVYHSMGYFLPLRWAGPRVVTVHDMNVYTQVRSWLRPATVLGWADLAIQTPLSVRVADRVITDSEFSRRAIERRIGAARGKVVVIPLAADPYFGETPSVAESDQATAIAHGQPYVLFVGILSPMKNLITLLRAYASSTLPAQGVRLVLAGSNREGYGAVLHDEARAIGIADQVDFPGFVPDATLRALYWNAMAVVLPSHGEGFGLPLVEAIAVGTPVLAADSQSIPEVLGSAGRLFEPHDARGLADLLTRLADDATFRHDLVEATRASRTRYSWRKTAEATVAVYEEVLAARRR